MIDEIKQIIGEYEDGTVNLNKYTLPSGIAYLQKDLCPNGITDTRYGTFDIDEYVAGVLKQEYGGLLANLPEAGKVAAIAARTFVIKSTNNCSIAFGSSEYVGPAGSNDKEPKIWEAKE